VERRNEFTKFVRKTRIKRDHLLENEGRDSINGSILLDDFIRRPKVNSSRLLKLPDEVIGGFREFLDSHEADQAMTEIKYAGYLKRERIDLENMNRLAKARIPVDFIFTNIAGLSTEVRERLDRVRPSDLAQAARIPGITPAAISILTVYLKKQKNLQGQSRH